MLAHRQRERYTALRDVIANKVKSGGRKLFMPGRYKDSASRTSYEEFWALRNVSFQIEQGEKVGIIGRNGAGKTTLLKILSRITEPTEGRVQIKGRVASLLEVGTGFHPELTGRENIYLNGAILGMHKTEIRQKFDEIVSFAEVEKFLDTPVKRYSSGMYVRLAFAVAAHLEPEILLVDEVLAVGDTSFQKKCLGKMNQIAGEGRTVLFVSHNMAIIQGLCKRTLLLASGNLVMNGETETVVSEYLKQMSSISEGGIIDTLTHPNRLPQMQSVIYKVSLQNGNGEYTTDFDQGNTVVLSVYYDASKTGQSLAGCGFHIKTLTGVRVGGFNTYMGTPPPHKLPPSGVVRFLIQEPTLTPGRYMITVNVGPHQSFLIDNIEAVLTFDIHTLDVYGTGYLLTPEDGVVAMKCDVAIENSLSIH